jgi:hypothetical protein
MILLPGFKAKVKQVQVFINRQPVKFKQQAEGLIIQTEGLDFDVANLVIQIELS